MSEDLKNQILGKWTFPWGLMDVLIGGKSPIDLKALRVGDPVEAAKFVESYGFDLKNSDDRKFIHRTIVEALFFVESTLMPREWSSGKAPPSEIVECSDVVQLLVWASKGKEDGKRGLLSVWACAILRVVHTIAHIHGVQKHADIDEARTQITARFRKALFRSKDSSTLLFGSKNNFVELEKFEWKNVKPRSSVILKLLHKPANVAETIYDFIGVRIVTKTYADVMQLVKILGDEFLISFPNANPKRARNSLIDLEQFKTQVNLYQDFLKKDVITPEDFLNKISEIQSVYKPAGKGKLNPHSGSSYRSIQMTCRQLIQYRDPSLKWMDKAAKYISEQGLKHKHSEVLLDTLDFVKSWTESLGIKENVNVFFPFEVQVFDSQTRREIEKSEANHAMYKNSQIRTARKRVLNDLLNFYKSL